MALRDSGYLMFFPENNQEVYDSVILAYKVAEDPKVMLPAIVNIDGPHNFMEPVITATEQSMKGFLSPVPRKIDTKKPLVLDIYQNDYDRFVLSQNGAMENALEIIAKVDEKWKQKFHRSFTCVERFMTDDAETIIVTMGYHSSTAKAAVKTMRASGKKVGVLRIRVFRPWPAAEVAHVLEKAKHVLVFDQAISVGLGGILAAHIKRPCSSLISLGKYPSEKDFIDAIARAEKGEAKLWL
jgi:pyruvate/2-oxoacid:ferredoxin oxidoreductase alpha subunit